MEIIQRYLNAIEFWLPKGQKDDIIAEISEDLHSKMEEQEAQLGRPLNNAEVDSLLKHRGNPLLVANRYLPQRSLIGPALYPIYLFVLKIWALCWPLPGVVVFVIVQRTQHPELSWSHTVAATAGWLWSAVFLAAGTITLAFVVLEKVNGRTNFLENWNPRKLPPVRDPNKISRLSSAIEVVANLVFLVLFVSYASSVNIIDGPALQITFSPVWIYFFWGFLVVALLVTVLAIANLIHPSWSNTRATIRLVLDAAGGALWCWLAKANLFQTFWLSKAHETATPDFAHMINNWLQWTFPYDVALVIVILGVDLYRIVRLNQKHTKSTSPGSITSALA